MSTAILERPSAQRPVTAFDAAVQATAQRNAAWLAALQAADNAARLRAVREWPNYGLNEDNLIVKRSDGTVYGQYVRGEFVCTCRHALKNHEAGRAGAGALAFDKHFYIRELLMGRAISAIDESGVVWNDLRLTPAEVAAARIVTPVVDTVLCDQCDLAFVFDEDAGDERLNGDGGNLYRCAACVTEDRIAKTELCDRWGIGKAVEI